MHHAGGEKAVESTKNSNVNKTNLGITHMFDVIDFLCDAFKAEIVGMLELYGHNV